MHRVLLYGSWHKASHIYQVPSGPYPSFEFYRTKAEILLLRGLGDETPALQYTYHIHIADIFRLCKKPPFLLSDDGSRPQPEQFFLCGFELPLLEITIKDSSRGGIRTPDRVVTHTL